MNLKYLTTQPPERFLAPGGIAEDVLLNTYPMQFLLLQEPSMYDLRAAIVEYATLRMDDVWNELMVPGKSGSGKVIRALATDEFRFYNVSHDLMRAHIGGAHLRPALKRIRGLSLDEQREFVAPLKPRSIVDLIAMIPDRSYDMTGFKYLSKAAEASESAKVFFERILQQLFEGIGKGSYTLGTADMGFHQARILEFLALSVRKGWLLFPFAAMGGCDKNVQALQHRDCARRYLNPVYAPVEADEICASTVSVLDTNTTGRFARSYIKNIFLCSTYRSVAQSSTALFERCIELADNKQQDAHRQKGFARKGYNVLLKLHAARHPHVPQQAQMYVKQNRRTIDEFASFEEIIKGKPHLKNWALRCSEYIKSLKLKAQSIVQTRKSFEDLLEFLAKHPAPPYRPELTNRSLINDSQETSYCLRNYLGGLYGPAPCNSKLSDVGAFFEFMQDRLRVEHDDATSEPPWFVNPVDIRFDKFAQKYRAGTNRKAIAADIMEEMRKILVEDDYAWPKQIESDWAHLVNADTNELENVWCPSAALCLYTLLSLPLRSVQARLLDSGEGDAEIFDFSTGRMIANPRQLPVDGKVEGSRREGFVQVMPSGLPADPDLVGMWISVNKTSEEGYAIPWISEDLLTHLQYQRDWIFKYTRNPMMYGVDDAQGHRDTPEEIVANESKFYCLFRDPSASVKVSDSLPVSKQKLRKIWGYLCLEAQDRINARASDDFRRVKLTRDKLDSNGHPVSIYDLHTLRVSGITDLLDRGVPLNIVSEYVAGHATYIMTLWYDVPALGSVRRAMLEANRRVGAADGALPRFTEAEIGRMRPHLVGNPLAEGLFTGFDALIENAGLIQVRQAGICPGTRCEEGGLTDTGRAIPVPVGDRGPSCPQCRFFLTGPAFLLGQAIEGNQLILKIRNKVAALADQRRRIIESEDAGKSREAALLRDQSDLEERHLNNMLTEWWHRMQFYESSIQKLDAYRASQVNSDGSAHEIALVRGQGTDGLRFGFGKATELELKHFMSTCTELLPNLVSESLGAHQDIELAVGRFLAINDQDELTTMFFKLDDEQRLTAANLMVELVNRASRSPIQSAELLSGRIELKALPSLETDFSKLLNGIAAGVKLENKVKELADVE